MHQTELDKTVHDQIDSTLDRMDESIFGRGQLGALPPGQKAKRIAVANAVLADLQQNQAMGGTALPLGVLTARHAHVLFSSLRDSALQNAVTQAQNFSKQQTTPPQSGNGQSGEIPLGDEAAARAVAAKMREMGMDY